MITRAPESCSCTPSWIGLSIARLYVVVAAALEWLGRRPSSPNSSPRRSTPARGSGVVQSLAEQGADFGRLEGVLTGCSDHLAAPWCVLARLVGKAAKKNDGTCACSLTALPVTDGLGENGPGGGQRPCARGLSIRTSLFPYSTVAAWSSPG